MSAPDRPLSAVATASISLSQMISALSYALDITEGQPMGHAVRSCLVGMRLADEILVLLRAGDKGARQLIETRCERGANIVRMLEFPDESSQAILALDEHWDGRGHPLGLTGEEIPLSGRIMGLAQTVDVFFCTSGVAGVYDMALRRRGTWFDPDLVDALCSFRNDAAFWERLGWDDIQNQVMRLEPEEQILRLDDSRLDRVAQAFASIIDAKSPWTYNHSTGVADIALGIGALLGLSAPVLRDLKRAALLHDIGKLGVSSLILDKPGKLDENEYAQMRQHSSHTQEILGRVNALHHVSELACSHHERLDGKGYHRRLTAEELSTTARILPIADIYQAPSADRPYRAGMPPDQALGIMRKEVGSGLCARAFAALERYLDHAGEATDPLLRRAS